MPEKTTDREEANRRLQPILDEFEEAIDAALRIAASFELPTET